MKWFGRKKRAKAISSVVESISWSPKTFVADLSEARTQVDLDLVLVNGDHYSGTLQRISGFVPQPIKAVVEDPDRLHQKYIVKRTDGKPVNEAFVLEDKDPLAGPALRTYIDYCKAAYPELAEDLEKMSNRWSELHITKGEGRG